MKTIYKSLVLTLLLICANTYAGDYYTINGSEDITFKSGADIYIDFSQVTSVSAKSIQLEQMGGCSVENHFPTYVKITFNSDHRINNSNNNGAGFQWQDNNNQWSHSGSSWAKFLNDGKHLPFPAKDSNCNCIRVTYDGSSAPTYTWISGYTPGGGGGAGGETGVGGSEISVSEATGNGTISEAAGCEGCYKTTFVTK